MSRLNLEKLNRSNNTSLNSPNINYILNKYQNAIHTPNSLFLDQENQNSEISGQIKTFEWLDEINQQFSGGTILEFSDKLDLKSKFSSWMDEIPENELNLQVPISDEPKLMASLK